MFTLVSKGLSDVHSRYQICTRYLALVTKFAHFVCAIECSLIKRQHRQCCSAYRYIYYEFLYMYYYVCTKYYCCYAYYEVLPMQIASSADNERSRYGSNVHSRFQG